MSFAVDNICNHFNDLAITHHNADEERFIQQIVARVKQSLSRLQGNERLFLMGLGYRSSKDHEFYHRFRDEIHARLDAELSICVRLVEDIWYDNASCIHCTHRPSLFMSRAEMTPRDNCQPFWGHHKLIPCHGESFVPQ
jgi:hypothetical protein